ncbi:DUF5105 domain-containing protein [Anaerostipes sp.]|uniref:DUF5105 domain-containing protein n=1 Tax=Anaerostipes sp. TaxID=1872530 RepID=UPI0025BCF1C5|nr:DUF5105 domain-containing protein [Anaerostipes sp.]MBS7007026.1 DUF5105 domain-containing protein [Anaerostipes sp.]
MKKHMKKKLAVLLSLVLVVSLALAGCKKKEEIPKPDKLVEAYYLMYTRGNTDEMVKSGTSEKKAKQSLKQYKTNMKSAFMSAANAAGGTFESEDADQVLDALLHALAKLKYEVKTDEMDEKEGTATVILKSQSIDLRSIQTKLMTNMQNAIKSGEIKQQSELGPYILSEMAKLIQKSKPTEEMKETTVNMKLKTVKVNNKEVKRWIPENINTFQTEMEKLFISQ